MRRTTVRSRLICLCIAFILIAFASKSLAVILPIGLILLIIGIFDVVRAKTLKSLSEKSREKMETKLLICSSIIVSLVCFSLIAFYGSLKDAVGLVLIVGIVTGLKAGYRHINAWYMTAGIFIFLSIAMILSNQYPVVYIGIGVLAIIFLIQIYFVIKNRFYK